MGGNDSLPGKSCEGFGADAEKSRSVRGCQICFVDVVSGTRNGWLDFHVRSLNVQLVSGDVCDSQILVKSEASE